MARFCPNCGTEVDDTAVFCPTCGQPIDQEVESQMPPAPAWPDPEPSTVMPARSDETLRTERVDLPAADPPPATAAPPRPDNFDDARAAGPIASRVEVRRSSGIESEPAPRAGSPSPVDEGSRAAARTSGADAPSGPSRPSIDVPFTAPVTLSAWLIGGGAAVGAVGALISLFDRVGVAVDILLLVVLGAVAISVFFAAIVPAIPHLRLVTLAVALIAFGIAFDRLALGVSGVGELLLFLGAAAAAIGALILELGRDQPLGTPQR